jgi:predicted ATPase/DNA-binding SARP family transcriptional activator
VEPRGGGVFEFRLLGPLEVVKNGSAVAPGGPRQRALLALLLLRANEVVPRERIVDGLWGERPPETAPNAIQVAVHALRRLLGRERLETRGAGYVLHADADELDLRRFERLLARSDAAALREALALWRGPALADLREAPFAAAEAERLDELRLVALERRIAADFELGAGGDLVPELRALVAEHPYRERFHAQLMLALYRGGRQAEALEAYAAARRRLVEELGMEPGPELRELEQRILRHDPGLVPASPAAPGAAALPTAPTPFLGRELELAAVTALLNRDEVRLLTLTGAGGTGKTRLALAAARELEPAFRDGARFVGLATVRDPALVASTVAAALGAGETGAGSVETALFEHLRDQHTLLVLDNFEQVTAAAPLVAELLGAAPRLKVLVTSRGVLRVSAEHEYPVPPLPLPDPADAGDPDSLLRNEAVALFVERARAVRPGFALDGEARAVVDICAALDGLPLALELAAARVKVLSPSALRDRLERRLPLLERGPADLPGRQRTMRATIDWSYDLLDEADRALFARLAVFAGGCTVEAAEAVCEADLDGLAALVDASLLRERPGGRAETRFAMLEVVREYAVERLEASGESERLRRRHAGHYADLGERAEPELTGAEAVRWLGYLEAEHDNIRAALAWAGTAGEREVELRLAGSMHYFWRSPVRAAHRRLCGGGR